MAAVTNGPLDLDLDTQQFTNGVHALDVVVRTVLLTSDYIEFASVSSVSATFSNFLTSADNGPFFSGGGATLKFNAAGAASYTLRIFDAGEVVKRTYSGTTTGGNIQIAWDGRDSGGNILPTEAAYTFRMATVATGGGSGGAAAAGLTNQVVTRSFSEGTFNAGFSYLVRFKKTAPNQSYETIEANAMNSLSSLIEDADLYGPDPISTRNVLNNAVFVWQANTQKTNILDAIKRKDVGHIFVNGHGSGYKFGAGEDTVITTWIVVEDVKAALTNNFDAKAGIFDFKNPKRYVELDGCNTSTGSLPLAFGIPKISTDRRPNMARRSYFGWNDFTTYGVQPSKYQKHMADQHAFWHDTDTQVSIQVAIIQAIVAENYQINVSEIGLFASRLLTWAVNTP